MNSKSLKLSLDASAASIPPPLHLFAATTTQHACRPTLSYVAGDALSKRLIRECISLFANRDSVSYRSDESGRTASFAGIDNTD